MGVQLDKQVDLSSVVYGQPWGNFVPAVTAGLQVFSLLGGTLAKSLINQGTAGASTVVGSPVVDTPSGLTMMGGSLSRISTAYTDVGGSMTVMVVGQTSDSTIGTYASSETTNADSLFSMRWGGGFFGVALVVGYNNSDGTVSALTLQGAASNSALVLAQMAVPSFFVAKVDMADLHASISCPTAPAILTGGATSFPAGSTRSTVGNPISVPSASIVESGTNAVCTIHAVAIFNRATTATEDAFMYAQMKGVMSKRGITI